MDQPPRFVSYQDLKSRFGIGYSRMHLSRLIAAEKFPEKIELSAGGRIGWLESDIVDWLNSRNTKATKAKNAA